MTRMPPATSRVRPAVVADVPVILRLVRELAEYEKALDEVDTLITDAGVASRARSILEESVDHLVLADVASAQLGSARAVGRPAGGGPG